MRKNAMLRHRFWSIVTGAEIPVSCHIGGGLLIPHPNGIVLNGHVTIGPNCLIFQQVTLGDGGRVPGVPTVGGHVDIGAGAKVLGGVHIGDHAKIQSQCGGPVRCAAPCHRRRHSREDHSWLAASPRYSACQCPQKHQRINERN